MAARRYVIWSLILIAVFAALAFFLVRQQREGARFPFRFGLDLVGGTELIYRADTSKVTDRAGAMASLKEVIERRVNIFGVSEPLVQTEQAGFASGLQDDRLIVELPGISDIEEAKKLIGQTPVLEFRLEKEGALQSGEITPHTKIDDLFIPTGLTGRYLSKASVIFDQYTQAPLIGINFNEEGAELFAKITRENKGEILAIILDGQILSVPVIQDEITNGQAQITGQFTPEEARELVRNLNYGALPVPIELSASQTIGSTLGEAALDSGVRAGVIGFAALALFLIFWYRLPGLIATIALVSYVILSLAIFVLIPVTLTAAGLAGFILSIGMAVDANVLIFERMKEEMQKPARPDEAGRLGGGKSIDESMHEGFARAWLSIRDSNIASLITATVLFWLGTSAVKGFALTLGIGVLVSMFTAITVSRTFLYAVAPKTESKWKRFLFSNGLHLK